jgi:hypothetical protein
VSGKCEECFRTMAAFPISPRSGDGMWPKINLALSSCASRILLESITSLRLSENLGIIGYGDHGTVGTGNFSDVFHHGLNGLCRKIFQYIPCRRRFRLGSSCDTKYHDISLRLGRPHVSKRSDSQRDSGQIRWTLVMRLFCIWPLQKS